jgi:GDP-D-mannose 3',5'-epimerase
MKHLITGGAGMIGSHLATRLIKEGQDVTVVDNLSSGSVKNIEHLESNPRFKFFKGDVRNSNTILQLTVGKDYVWGLSAKMGGMGFISTHHADIMHDNVLMNANTLQAAYLNKVPHYFMSSSACAYAVDKQTSADVIPLKEEDAYPGNPNEAYGWEKLYSEQMAAAYQQDYQMNIRIARFHNIYGDGYSCFGRTTGKAPCHIILKAIKHPTPPFNIWGTGEATRSFCHFSDCIEMMLRLVDSNYDKPINIGSDRLVTINKLAEIVIDISGKKITPLHVDGPVGVMGRNADLTLMRKVLHYEPSMSLEKGLEETYAWALNHYSELEGI